MFCVLRDRRECRVSFSYERLLQLAIVRAIEQGETTTSIHPAEMVSTPLSTLPPPLHIPLTLLLRLDRWEDLAG